MRGRLKACHDVGSSYAFINTMVSLRRQGTVGNGGAGVMMPNSSSYLLRALKQVTSSSQSFAYLSTQVKKNYF